MKTQSTTSTHPEQKYSVKSIERAKQYAAHAIINLILRQYYMRLAKSPELSNAKQAAMDDYLKHEREFRELNKKL